MLYIPPQPSALQLLATATAAAVAAVDFTANIDATFDHYWIQLLNVLPATDGAILWMRTSGDGGATFDAAAADYYVASSTAAQVAVTAAASFTAARGGISGHLAVYSPADAALPTTINGFLSYSNNVGAGTVFGNVHGRRDALSAVNGVRFLFNVGDIASGKFKLYGVKR